jgi:phosphoserine phosphatase RsbU/P
VPKLRFQNGPRRNTEFAFDKRVMVGRRGNADLSIDDPTISRRHAVLTWMNEECTVLDLGSGNGTFINGRIVSKPTRLRDGDVVTIGSVSAIYSDSSASPPDATDPLRGVTVVPDAPSMLFRIPAADEAAAALQQLEPNETIAALTRRLRFLNELGKITELVFDGPALLSFVLDQIFDLMPQTERGFIMLWDPKSASLLPKASRTREGTEAPYVVSQTLIGDVLGKHQAVLVADAQSDPRYSKAESVLALGIRTAMGTPVLFHDEFFGIIQIDSRTGALFGKTDLVLLVGIAAQVGMALAYARLHESLMEQRLLAQDMQLARRIQQRFLPESTPASRGYSFAVTCNPALSVGGDFYDFLDLGGGLIGVVIGDVSGKGVSAALYAAKLTSDLRHQAVDQRDPRAILTRVNHVLTSRDTEGMFATVIVIVVDPGSGRIAVANAGHPLPYLRARDGRTDALGHAGGAPVGMFEDCTFAHDEYELARGDCIVLYTDGITEALNEREELFGDQRLIDTIRQSAPGASRLMEIVRSEVGAFAGTHAQSDDITILCFGRE